MNDSKLIQGLVLAACIFLAVGIAFTMVEINRYKAVGTTTPSAGPPAAVETGGDEAPPDTEVVPVDTPADSDVMGDE